MKNSRVGCRIAVALVALLCTSTVTLADCRADLSAALDEFSENLEQVRRLGQLIADLQETPGTSDLPEIELVVSGDRGTLKPVGPERTLANVAAQINGLLSSYVPESGPITNVTGAAIDATVSRFDVQLPLEEAQRIYDEYQRIKAGSLEERAIRLQSCALYRTQDAMFFYHNRFLEAYAKIDKAAFAPACSDFDMTPIYKWEQQISYIASESVQAGNAKYVPDLTGCFETPADAPVWVRGAPRIEPSASQQREWEPDQFDNREISESGFVRHQRKHYGVQDVYEELTWKIENTRGVPDKLIGGQTGVLRFVGTVVPGYDPALKSAEGVSGGLRCVGKCQFLNIDTKRPLGGWIPFRLDRGNSRLSIFVFVRPTARPDESFELEFSAGGLKVTWPYTPG